jgi:DNA-binding CsgD family transcriptional regulator
VRKYLQAYQDVFNCGIVLEDTVKKHIDTHLLIDSYLPDSAAFFYIVKYPDGKYNFLGKQQEHVSGYSNEEFIEKGVELFLQSIHPEQIDLILHGVYPDITAFLLGLTDDQAKKSVLIQYNYQFRRKDGSYINLLEHVHVLELDNDGRPAVVLGNVIMLQNTEMLPLRLTIKRFGQKEVSETVHSKVYTTLQSKQNITNREVEILRYLATGKTSKEIGQSLFISQHTVDTHRRNLLRKLDCNTVVELTKVAFQNALL